MQISGWDTFARLDFAGLEYGEKKCARGVVNAQISRDTMFEQLLQLLRRVNDFYVFARFLLAQLCAQ